MTGPFSIIALSLPDFAGAMDYAWLGVSALVGVLLVAAAIALRRAGEERRANIAALTASEERHRAVVQQASEGIYLVDVESHVIVEANPAMCLLMGCEPGRLVDRPVYDMVNDKREGVDARIQRVLKSPTPVSGERNYRRDDGTFIDVVASATVITYAGRKVLCTVVHDITEQKRNRQLLEERNQQLLEVGEAQQKAYQALQAAQSQLVQAEKLAGLGQMVAGVAHEINNPLSFVANNVAVLQRDLTAIRKLLELYRTNDATIARESPDSAHQIRELAEQVDLDYALPNIDELLARSREGLRRIQQIVKDLRDFARLDEGDLKASDLNAGITSTANIIVGRAKKKKVRIDLQLQSIPLVTCFPAKVNQVVMNLLSNAIDATPEGSTVTVSTRCDGETVQIEVADHGSGVPPEIAGRIFDPFFTTKRQGEGTGLGLSISYGIAQEHGGKLEVVSEVGHGARFILHLPIERMPASKSGRGVSPAR